MSSFKKNQGLTLIEILVVIGIIAVIVGFGMSIDLNAFKGDTFRTEESTIVSVLEKARSRAMANMYQTTHGVCYNAGNYIIFRTRTACLPTAATDETFPANTNIATTSNFSTTFPTVVFNQLSGKLKPQLVPADTETDITITDGIKTAHIKINNEGTINW